MNSTIPHVRVAVGFGLLSALGRAAWLTACTAANLRNPSSCAACGSNRPHPTAEPHDLDLAVPRHLT